MKLAGMASVVVVNTGTIWRQKMKKSIVAPQQDQPPGEGGCGVHNEGDGGLQRALGQAVDGEN